MYEKNLAVKLTIDEKDAGEFFLADSEVDDNPETTAYDLSRAITEQLNNAGRDSKATITMMAGIDRLGSPEMACSFRNGGRGWDHRKQLEGWFYLGFGFMANSDCEHGPVSTEANRADAKANDRNLGEQDMRRARR